MISLKRHRVPILLITLLAAVCTLVFLAGTGATVGRQTISAITLETSESPIEIGGPASALVTSPNEDETVYIVNGLTGEVGAYKNGSTRSYRAFARTAGPLVVPSRQYIAYIDGARVVIAGSDGMILNHINTPPGISLAVLSNGNIVVASPMRNHFLHLYTPTGQLLRSFGSFKKRESFGQAENQFLHKGKLLVDASDNIYYVFHYLPLVQKFSSTGELEREIKVEGDAIDLQQELAKRFFTTREPNTIGGITIINSAAVDRKTGHLWVGLNGSSITGTAYEYDTDGEKLREYALKVNYPSAIPEIITGVKDIAIAGSQLYVLTNQHQVFSFERKEGSTRSKPIISQSGRFKQERYSIKPVFWASTSSKPVLRAQGSCGTGQTWADCGFNCPEPQCVGNMPTATSSNSLMLDCKAALASTLTAGYTVVSANCTQYPAGTAMHMRGGCFDTVRICRMGINSDHSLTIDCQPPICGGGGGGGGCEQLPPIGGCGNCYDWDWDLCMCVYVGCSPVVVDVLGNGFDLTGLNDGVDFDLNGDGIPTRFSWTAPASDDAWLALDRNGNGVIDNGRELFGSYTAQPSSSSPNGFIALAEFDKPGNGGNGDGRINPQDAIFSSLRLWQDTNHNGYSEASELHRLLSLGLAAIDLDYKESRRTDQYGNAFRYRAKVRDTRGAQLGRWAWDVFLLSQ